MPHKGKDKDYEEKPGHMKPGKGKGEKPGKKKGKKKGKNPFAEAVAEGKKGK